MFETIITEESESIQALEFVCKQHTIMSEFQQ
jgi:hypothetical protein